jgi:hypothetical protein
MSRSIGPWMDERKGQAGKLNCLILLECEGFQKPCFLGPAPQTSLWCGAIIYLLPVQPLTEQPTRFYSSAAADQSEAVPGKGQMSARANRGAWGLHIEIFLKVKKFHE